ncbi:MAG TPA: hypothetical protein VHK45_03985 [Geminicoccaceae bacterium]|jgi:hypothetical protein|nr:hypothetical protein [Geminicoccaceae bacterium]
MTVHLCRPFAAMTIFSLAACASIVSDSKEMVTINSSPPAAQIAIADQSGIEVYRGTTPATVTLDASAGYFDGQKYTITFSKAGYKPATVQVDSRINGWYVGNIVFGGFIGWLVVDPLTGAMWALDSEHVSGSLAETVAMDETSSPQLRIVALDSVPESARSRMIQVR